MKCYRNNAYTHVNMRCMNALVREFDMYEDMYMYAKNILKICSQTRHDLTAIVYRYMNLNKEYEN